MILMDSLPSRRSYRAVRALHRPRDLGHTHTQPDYNPVEMQPSSPFNQALSLTGTPHTVLFMSDHVNVTTPVHTCDWYARNPLSSLPLVSRVHPTIGDGGLCVCVDRSCRHCSH